MTSFEGSNIPFLSLVTILRTTINWQLSLCTARSEASISVRLRKKTHMSASPPPPPFPNIDMQAGCELSLSLQTTKLYSNNNAAAGAVGEGFLSCLFAHLSLWGWWYVPVTRELCERAVGSCG